jgi:hypothetical protein
MSSQYIGPRIKAQQEAMGEDDGHIWRNGAFAGEFGDAFIQDTELEGGHTAPAIITLAGIVEEVLVRRRKDLALFSDAEIDKVKVILKDLRGAAELDADKDRVSDSASEAAFAERFMDRLKALGVGQRLAFGGGWMKKSGGHALMHVAERTAKGFTLIVCNTGQGVGYHPSIGRDYPKTKHKTAIALADIPSDRFLDPALWYVFWSLRTTARNSNDAEVLYEVLLPHLVDGVLPPAIHKAGDKSGHYESIQRSGVRTPHTWTPVHTNGCVALPLSKPLFAVLMLCCALLCCAVLLLCCVQTCYFRCILTCFRYLLKADGFSQFQQKQLFYANRLGFLDRIERGLNTELKEFTDSDRRMVAMAASQTALAAVKEHKRGSLSEAGLTAVHAFTQRLVKAAADAVTDASSEAITTASAAFRMAPSAPLVPYAGFGLLAEDGDTDRFAGGPTEASPELFVDLMPPAARPTTIEAVADEIAECLGRCNKLRAKTSVSAASIALHQICTLIEFTFCGTNPNARCPVRCVVVRPPSLIRSAPTARRRVCRRGAAPAEASRFAVFC